MNLKKAIPLGAIVLVALLFCYPRYLSPTARLRAAMEDSDAPAIAKAIRSGANLHAAPNRWLAFMHLTPQPYRPYAIMSGIAHSSDPQLMQLLLKGGADPNKRDETGLAPLHYAASRGNISMLAVLLDAGAKIDVTAPNPRKTQGSVLLGQMPEEGMTPLMVAAGIHADQCVAFLLKRGARADLKDAKGRTALQIVNEKQKRFPRTKPPALLETQRLLTAAR